MADGSEIIGERCDSKEVAFSLYVPPPNSKKPRIRQPRGASFSLVSGAPVR